MLSSELAEARVSVEQSCYLPTVGDGTPMVGAVPGVDGAYVATGGGCWGILCGPAMGKGMAELIVDGTASSVSLAPFDPRRFVRWTGAAGGLR
jgi:glycine/D-amino acid oxidase-like deaminating enzyme